MDKSLQIKLSPRITEIVTYYFTNPSLTYTELASHFNITVQRISAVMNNERVLSAYPVLAKRRIKSMIPKAINRLDHLMNQNENMAVSEKIVSKILDSEKVLQPSEHKIVHELHIKSVAELQEIIAQGRSLPGEVIEGELVGENEDKE